MGWGLQYQAAQQGSQSADASGHGGEHDRIGAGRAALQVHAGPGGRQDRPHDQQHPQHQVLAGTKAVAQEYEGHTAEAHQDAQPLHKREAFSG